jgi:hypothetical protein
MIYGTEFSASCTCRLILYKNLKNSVKPITSSFERLPFSVMIRYGCKFSSQSKANLPYLPYKSHSISENRL